MLQLDFLCIFSVLCFGDPVQKSSKALSSDPCDAYKYSEDKLSFKCYRNGSLTSLIGHNIHTLALTGIEFTSTPSQLINLTFNHLIVQNSQLPGSLQDINESSVPIDRSSLTILDSYNIDSWQWSLFNFNHIHIECCPLSDQNATTSQRLFSSNLRSLSLISCDLRFIKPESFAHLIMLKSLTISHNQLTSFPRKILPDKHSRLSRIDLSFNHLETLDPNFSHEMSFLKEINLSSNNLKIVAWSSFKPIWTQLDYLNLSDNQIECKYLCWSIGPKSFARPFMFDQTDCLIKVNKRINFATGNQTAMGCAVQFQTNCLQNTRFCKKTLDNKIICV